MQNNGEKHNINSFLGTIRIRNMVSLFQFKCILEFVIMPRRKRTQASATVRSQKYKCISWAIERLYIERKFVFRIVYYCLDENLGADIAMLNKSQGQSERRL